MAWSDWLEAAGTVWDWFEDSDTAQDLVGLGLQKAFYDSPELDINQIRQLAAQQAMIDSPDQNTPTMISDWTVDPETGERTQNLSYRPEFQGLLDMLVQRAGSEKDTYRAPEGMTTGLLGSRMNHLLTQSGQPTVDHQRAEFPSYAFADFSGANFGGGSTSTPQGSTTPTGGNGPGLTGGGQFDIGDEPTNVGGGFEEQGDGFNQNGDGFAGQFDSAYDNEMLIRDLTGRGFMQPGQSFQDVNWDAVFSDGNLEFIEKWGSNKIIKALLGKLIPGAGLAAGIGSFFAGNELDNRFGGRLSDFDNQQWGSYDTGAGLFDQGTNLNGLSDSFWTDLLGNPPGVNPDTGARLGETGGMPGATQNQDDIWRLYGDQGGNAADIGGSTYGREGIGRGDHFSGLQHVTTRDLIKKRQKPKG